MNTRHRRSFPIVLTVAAVLMPSTVGNTTAAPTPVECVVAEEPNDAAADAQVLPATAVCVTAEHDNPSQDLYTWTVGEAEAEQRWTIATTGIPSQAITLQVHRVEIDDAGTVLSTVQLASANGGSGVGAALTNLLWPAGEYVVGVGASGPGPYELSITPGDPTPEANDIEPNDAADQATPLTGTVAVSGDRAGSQDWFAWELDETAAAQLWQLDLVVPVLTSTNLRLASEDGTERFYETVGVGGSLRVPDLALAPGRYLISVDSTTDPFAPYILELTPSGPRTDGTEAEPNDTPANATSIVPTIGSTTVDGRLATMSDGPDIDMYGLTVGGDTAGRQMDLKLFWQGGSVRRFCLQDAVGNTLQCGESDHAVVFNDLVLQAGEYGIAVSGAAAPDDPYLLRLDVTEEPTSGFEAEPNDTNALATPLDVSGDNPSGSGRLIGQAGGPDTDVFRFTVTGEPQLWEVTATGPGVTGIAALDATGTPSMANTVTDGAATLYDVFLLPGDRSFRVVGDFGEYTIVAVPLGPPDPQAEHEPNDSFDYSQPIHLNETRTGRVVQASDADVYRFSVQNETHVLITVDSPPDAQLQLLLDSRPAVFERIGAREPGEAIAYDAVLPPGDYTVSLTPTVPSEGEYGLTVEPLDPYTVSDDAEPNDTAAQARPFPGDFTTSGVLDPMHLYGDVDWYVIPAQEAGGTTTFQVTGDNASIELLTTPTLAAPSTSIAPIAGAEAGAYTADLPADTPVLLGVRGQGDYEIAIEAVDTGMVEAEPDGALPVEIELAECAAPVAAYWADGQRLDCRLDLTNTGDVPLDITLDATTGHYAWTVEFESDTATIEPGDTESVPVAVHVAPDAWADQPILVTARARSDSGAAATGSVPVVPNGEAPPLNSEPFVPLPAELLGGLDVAWTGLGAAPVAADDVAATEEALLFDQQTPVGSGWQGDVASLPVELTVDLAGDDPVPVAGITLNPQGGPGSVAGQLRAFDLELSLDGQTFTSVLSGALSPIPVEQAFALSEPVEARFARLRVRSGQNVSSSTVVVGEWAVIAVPGWNLPSEFAGAGLDVADPNRGGHVVEVRPAFSSYVEGNNLLIEEDLRRTVRLGAGEPFSWIVGFHQDRAAQLTSLTWTDPTGSVPEARFGEVQVEVSVEGPAGPWMAAGTWTLDRGTPDPLQFAFAEPTWARFVRLTGTTPAGDPAATLDWELPDAIGVYERAPDETYRSMLGEWGQYRQSAIYEQLSPPRAITIDADAGNDGDSATLLPLGTRVNDTAWVGQDEDWYRVEVPSGESALAFTLGGDPTVDVEVTVFDSDGEEVPVEVTGGTATETTFTTRVEPEAEYLVRVTEPPSSVVFAFDTSASMVAYAAFVYQGLIRYVGDVEQGQETVNVVPFGTDLLLDTWSDEPYLLQAAITNYPQTVSSSDAEAALLASMDALATQEGAKAIVIITDAMTTPSADAMAELWPQLDGVRPRVYAVHVLGGTPLDQDLMQDWASMNDGLYTYVHNQGEMDIAFDRAATILRRQSLYSLSVEPTEPPPPPTTTTTTATSATTATTTTTAAPTTVSVTTVPVTTQVPADGFLRVLPAPVQPGQPVAIGGDASVAIILDTSGSMLQDLEGEDRIDAARSALTMLVTQTIPAGTNVSLRVFGDTPDSCDTRLLVPQSPLDPAAMAAVIQNVPVVDGVKTPIGASLQQVAGDLGTAPGPKIVVLVTDGEETCDGDPAAAIQALIDSGIDVRVNIVGFTLDDEALKAQFEEWARLGNGQYIDAGNEAELTAAMAAAVQPTFDVLDASGAVIASGQVGGDPVAVPAGTYVLEVRSEPPQRFDITVIGTQTLDLPLP